MSLLFLQPPSITNNHETNAFMIPNSDATPRWVWPIGEKKALFLKFYNSTTLKQKIFVLAVKAIFFCKLQNLFFKRINVSTNMLQDEGWALFTGTKGPNSKQITYINLTSNFGFFLKLVDGSNSKDTIKNEFDSIHFLQSATKEFSFQSPQILDYNGTSLKLSALNTTSRFKTISELHFTALRELREFHSKKFLIKDIENWNKIKRSIQQKEFEPKDRYSTFLMEELNQLFDTFKDTSSFSFCFAHGDFTPWNTMKTSEGNLGIIDWELADKNLPHGFDFFHYIFQYKILQERAKWKEIYKSINDLLTDKNKMQIFGTTEIDTDVYLKLFLAFHIGRYVNLYAQQEEWHDQIFWQIKVWEEALVWSNLSQSNRQSFIRHFFSELKNKKYAALKLDNIDPTTLNVYSDLDIIIEKQKFKTLNNFINGHPLINRVKCVKKSFMSSYKIIFKDETMLCIDLIWTIKRKAFTFMDTHKMIKNAEINDWGIKTVSPADTYLFVQQFYNLNHQEIPTELRLKYPENLAHHSAQEYQKTHSFLKEQNSGIQYIKHAFLYLLDSARTMISNRGYTITFSGVDGAGKSTILEEVKNEIEKLLRKPVVVLRHRPSILPIISAFKYGKETAEQRSMANLPRTGNNNSKISSTLRFLYYYSDYFFGQFYIFFKYTIRGYVVIYDRYYYDFINDPKRSNLVIDPAIAKLGYKFLMKPRYNFFLYANPEIILSRKKELSSVVITSLTQNYLDLFSELQASNKKKYFLPIENIVKKYTVNTILSILKPAL